MSKLFKAVPVEERLPEKEGTYCVIKKIYDSERFGTGYFDDEFTPATTHWLEEQPEGQFIISSEEIRDIDHHLLILEDYIKGEAGNTITKIRSMLRKLINL